MPPDDDFNDLSRESQVPYSGEINRNGARTDTLHSRNDDETPMNDVDFKYLSQLIHRVDLNKSNYLPERDIRYGMTPLRDSMVGRRNYNNDYFQDQITSEHPPHISEKRRNLIKHELDNDFYSNLGRQIASMIRSIDSNAERQVNIEIEKSDSQSPNHPIFSENTYSPRSYWERSVRSPLQRYFQPGTKMFEYLKNSNERLFNLESKVEVAASTPRLMSLQELESILNNVDENPNARLQDYQQLNMVVPTNRNTFFVSTTKPLRLRVFNQYPVRRQLMNNLQNIAERKTSFDNLTVANKTDKLKLNINFIRPTRKPNNKITNTSVSSPQFRQLQFIKKIRSSSMRFTTHHPNFLMNVNPHDHQNFYFDKNANEKTYPMNLPIVRKQFSHVHNTPRRSYFHHEFHHFDYFDQ